MRPSKKLIAVFGAGCAVTALAFAGYSWWRARPRPQTEYYGATFADGKAEIQYKLGSPDHVLDPTPISGLGPGWELILNVNSDPAKDKNSVPAGTTIRDYDELEYDQVGDANSVTVSFRKSNSRVNEIKCIALHHDVAGCKPVMGISVGTTEDELRQRLGQPTAEHLDGVTKSMLYRNLHLEFTLEKQRVYILAVGLYELTKQPNAPH
jgi:hypothetical protein